MRMGQQEWSFMSSPEMVCHATTMACVMAWHMTHDTDTVDSATCGTHIAGVLGHCPVVTVTAN